MTPIRKQYLEIKRQHPDAILLFRLGDFYETFDEDARVAARELDIVLTSREMGKGNAIPLAGIPYHAAEGYIARLVSRGYKVAICEQMGEARGRDLVERKVVRVVTPGTVVEPAMLEPARNNYLVAAFLQNNRAGVAFADISTGEFATTQIQSERPLEALKQELDRLKPAELLLPAAERRSPDEGDGVDQLQRLAREICPGIAPSSVSPVPEWRWGLDTARQTLLRHFDVRSLDGFGCASLPLAMRAAGALLQYVADTRPAAAGQIVRLATYSTERYMALDPQTRRNLEIVEGSRGADRQHSLLGILDHTCTSVGARLLYRWLNQPLLDLHRLRNRQEAVAQLHADHLARTEVRQALKRVGDVERLTNRAVQGTCGPRELAALRETLRAVPPLRNRLQRSVAEAASPGPEAGQTPPSPLQALCERLRPRPELLALLDQALGEDPPALLDGGDAIRAGFSQELDETRQLARDARQWVASLERRERERTGIKSLKVGFNKVFGYYLEVSSANASSVPPDFVRKQTLVGAERYFTPELKEYETKILNAQDREKELERVIFKQLLEQVAAEAAGLLETATTIAHLDVFCSLAEAAARHGYVRPVLDDSGELEIIGGRHPVVERFLQDDVFVPNDTHLSTSGAQIVILTGPNMAGKSTYLRQVALIALMAQVGSFVPAASARVGLVDRIFTRVGAQDDIATGQSTFMVEMAETAFILSHASPRSLVVLDEVGRGTSTYDGLAIAQAVVEYLHNNPRVAAKTLFATHYHELTALAEVLPRVCNARMDVLEEGDRVVFLHRVVEGGADRSYGIYVARLAGVPRGVLRRAEEILRRLEAPAASTVQTGRGDGRAAADSLQLPMFGAPDPILEELRGLDVLAMTPIEALTRLFELQRRATPSE